MPLTLSQEYSLAPLKLNAAVLPVLSVSPSPGTILDPFGHSGNEFATHQRIAGAEPALDVTMLFQDAFALIGWKSLKLTTLEVYAAKYVDSIRSASSVHHRKALAVDAIGYATIQSVSCGGPRALAIAEVRIVLLSSDGQTHPLVDADNAAIPAVTTGPTLQTLAPFSYNGTDYSGLQSLQIDTGNRMEVTTHGGMRYPTLATYLGGQWEARASLGDPALLATLFSELGSSLAGNFDFYLRNFDANDLGTVTGTRMRIARGAAIPEQIPLSHLELSRPGFRVSALANPSTPGTHPVVVATGQTVPT